MLQNRLANRFEYFIYRTPPRQLCQFHPNAPRSSRRARMETQTRVLPICPRRSALSSPESLSRAPNPSPSLLYGFPSYRRDPKTPFPPSSLPDTRGIPAGLLSSPQQCRYRPQTAASSPPAVENSSPRARRHTAPLCRNPSKRPRASKHLGLWPFHNRSRRAASLITHRQSSIHIRASFHSRGHRYSNPPDTLPAAGPSSTDTHRETIA